MSQSINWQIDVQLAGGAKHILADTFESSAVDQVEIVVPPAAGGGAVGNLTVHVQPGGAGAVQFLMMTANIYHQDLTYTVDGGAAIKLDAPLFLLKEGAIGLLGATQKDFVFSNAIVPPTPVSITILVGRATHL